MQVVPSRKFSFAAFAVLFLILASGTAAEAVELTFDTLSDGQHMEWPANVNYGGLDWSAGYMYVESYGNFVGRGGSSAPFPSGQMAIYNGYGVSATTVSKSSLFDFNGAWFAGWNNTDLPPSTGITLNGYRDGALIGSVSYGLTGAFKWCPADFSGVNRVDIVSSNSPNWWLMDNFTYDQPLTATPEPVSASLFLLGAGLFGINRFRKNKKS